MTPSELASRHRDREYNVAFVGFSPGFGYLVGGDPLLRVPRLESPRPSVPAGSVAVASEFSAVYPQATPGGWRIIGSTRLEMFNAERTDPSLLSPGDTVQFVPETTHGAASACRAETSAATTAGDAYVHVLDPGPLTTVQDCGRPGWAHVGVPRAGAADRRSAAFANALVGNHPCDALLEATLAGPSLRVGSDVVVAVTGAKASITVDGLPARADTALFLRSGSELVVGRAAQGARIYIAFSGGIAFQPVLGSRSTDTLSGIGPAPLTKGSTFPLNLGPSDPLRFAPSPTPHVGSTPLPSPNEILVVPAIRGPRDGWVGQRGMETLGASVFEVGATSDRTGLRLSGPAVTVDRGEQLPSEGMVAGAVQVPPNGSPIVLLRNHPTTGGYPVAAVVTEEGVDVLSQAPPGVRVRFDLR
jgi:biotin-dependent carboxylase-like uncharacterized protein